MSLPRMSVLGWLVASACVVAGCGRSSKCDLPKLHGLTKAISQNEREAAKLVADGLGQACDLPPALAGFFAVSEVTRVPQSEQLRSVPGPERIDSVLALACPKPAREEVAAAAPEAKLSLAYDHCNFGRLGVEDRATWLATHPSWPDPFVTYIWLKEQGVSEAAARPLARAMIAHDRRHWAETGQQLPEVRFALPAIPNDVGDPVYLNNTALLYRGNKLASLRRDGTFEASATHAMQVKLLARDLASAAAHGPLVVVSDRRVSAAAIQKVLHTAQQAGVGRFGLVVSTGPESYAMVPAFPRKARHPLDVSSAKGLAIDLELQGDQVYVRLSSDKSNPRWIDIADFGAWATSIRNLFPGRLAVTVVPGSGSYENLAHVLAELRGPCEPSTSKHACLEPGVVVTPTPRPTERLSVFVDGKVRFRGLLHTRTELAKPLCEAVARRGEAFELEIVADPDAPHSQVVEVMDVAKKCGATKLSIVVR